MSQIDELVEQLCPDGVPFKPLSELGQFVRGSGMPKSDFRESGVGCIHYGQIYTYYGTWATETISFVAPETAKPLAKVDHGDVLVTNTSENLDDVCKAVAWLGRDQIVTGGHASVFKHHQDPKFVSYYFQTSAFEAEKRRYATGTKVIDVSAKSLAKIRIPVPPLQIQHEIARILDSFTELEAELHAELQAELDARRQQYARYREGLLRASETDVAFTPLGSLCKVLNGYAFESELFNSDGVGMPLIRIRDVNTRFSSTYYSGEYDRRYLVEDGDIVIGMDGDFTAVRWSHGTALLNQRVCRLQSFHDEILPDFLFYRVQDELDRIHRATQGSTVKHLSSRELERSRIPVPPLDEQRRIVEILDRFDGQVNDLSIGLQAELAARRKQHGYYRDRLLTFEEAA